jgi:hypothetical protein
MNNGPITYELDGKQYFGGGWRQLVVRFCLTKTKMITLDSAQAAYDANALPPGSVDLDAVYVGLGTEADFIGSDRKPCSPTACKG